MSFLILWWHLWPIFAYKISIYDWTLGTQKRGHYRFFMAHKVEEFPFEFFRLPNILLNLFLFTTYFLLRMPFSSTQKKRENGSPSMCLQHHYQTHQHHHHHLGPFLPLCLLFTHLFDVFLSPRGHAWEIFII